MKKILLIFISVMLNNLSGKEVNILQASLNDVDTLQELNLQLGYEMSNDEMIQKIKLYTSSDANKLWVAKLNDQIVGYIAVNVIQPFHENIKYLRIDSLIVDEKHAGMGIGKKLISFVEKYAKDVDCKKIILSSNNKRLETHKFYLKMGYISDSKYFVKYLKYGN